MESILKISSYLKTLFLTAFWGLCIYFLINIGNNYVQSDKKIKLSKKKISFMFLIIVFIIAIYYIFKGSSKIGQVLLLVFYSAVLAYLLNPLVSLIEKLGIKRTLSILLVFLLLIGFLIIVAVSIVPKLMNEFENLIIVLPSYFNKIYDYFDYLHIKYFKHIDNLPPEFQAIKEVFLENLNSFQLHIINWIKSLINSSIRKFSKLISFFIVPILTFYFLKDKDFFRKKIILFIPKDYRHDALKISREIDNVLGKFIKGQLLVAAYVGAATSVVLLIIGIDFAIIIGLIAGIADIIPYFGPIIGILPAVTFALLESPVKALWVIVSFVFIQQLECNVIEPKIIGNSVGLHPVVIIFSLIISGSYFGIIGMLFAIPATLIIKIVSSFIIDRKSGL
ncbi:Predicted PurR-regulated permease PerM [Proteiniborus ethanoligenes]|uniref:Predicted PurR-regulated permease PerM n=1 Tax=Proteiniborus ethanoligenes TaxID=415015 RepID=A0A1H3K3X5_9FIRM|nr:AI-2E family transporter [Proteiniborus ethanoligenes]SDY46298.1 Predicted PurR-regulated permease PerM [Proteiniborus ethanoligenes]